MQPGPAGFDELRSWLEQYLELCGRLAPVSQAWSEAFASDVKFGALGSETLRAFTTKLERRIEAMGAVHPHVTALALVGMLDRFSLYVRYRRLGVTRDEMLDGLTDVVLGMLFGPDHQRPGWPAGAIQGLAAVRHFCHIDLTLLSYRRGEGEAGGSVDVDLLERVRETLPPQLNAGILASDGGYCVLGWMLSCAGFHGIALYNNTISVADPAAGGPAIDVVAERFGMPTATVAELAQLNDATDTSRRREVVEAKLVEIIAAARAMSPEPS